VQIQNSANGKVFEWVAPVSGVPQGKYEPVRLLIAPKKQQMISIGGNLRLNRSAKSEFEIALSNYDINTFSSKDADDNIGYSVHVSLEKRLSRDTTKNYLNSALEYQLINKHFTEIERFRPVEFERDWNLETPLNEDEHNASVQLSYRRKKILSTSYLFSLLTSANEYDGYKNNLNVEFQKTGFDFSLNSSILNTNSTYNKTQFIKSYADLSKSFKIIKAGIENEFEDNKWNENLSDSLLNNSFSFSSYRIYLENPDSSVNKYSLSYKIRNDFLPFQNDLKHATKAEDFQFGFSLLKNPLSILKTRVNFRKLEVLDTNIIQQKEENTLTGRLDYSFRILKGAIISSTFYEAASGLEPRREFSYLKVTDGQGIYYWEDYNGNGAAELDEFEIAQFQDQANYIRIYTPSNDYIKTYKNEFSQVLNIRPEAIWRSATGIKKFISRFSDNFAYQVNQKSIEDNLKLSLNPFYSPSNDSVIINTNQNFRNTFSFNRLNSKFGIDYIYQRNESKMLLSNGFDRREKTIHAAKIRWKVLGDFILQNYSELGSKNYESEFFSAKNYFIKNLTNETKMQYQPGFQTKVELNYSYTDKINSQATEHSITHNIGAEINYTVSKKGNLLAKGNYLNIHFNSDPNTSIAYEMLQGLKPGHNGTWSISYQRKLSGYLEMNLLYNGRASEKLKAIHTGSLQLRAFF